jgi:hypothetical protein
MGRASSTCKPKWTTVFSPAEQPTPTNRLVVRSDILPHENLRGWLLRLSGLNGLSGIKEIFALAGISGPIGSISDVDFAERLAAITNIDCRTITRRFAGDPDDRRISLRGIPSCSVTPFAYLSQDAQVCPVCLEESCTIPATWDLKFWVVCPLHKCRMLRACSSCGEAIRWSRPHVNRCHSKPCKSLFSQGLVTPARSEIIALVRWLSAIINQDHPHNSELNKIFDGVDLSEALRMIALFGRYSAAGLTAAEAALDDWAIVDAAAKILCKWPAGFHRLLDRTSDRLQGRGSLGLSEYPFYEAYGRVQGRSESQRLSVSGPIIKAELLSYIEQRSEDPAKTQWRLRKHADQDMRDWVIADQAARLLNMHNSAVQELVNEGILEGEFREAGSFSYLFLNRKSLEKFAGMANRGDRLGGFKSRTNALSLPEAAEYLGIGTLLVGQLGEAKFLSKIYRFPREYYSFESVNRLVKIFSQAVTARKKEKMSRRQLGHPWLKRGRSYLSLPDLVQAISSGYLSPIKEDPSRRGLLRFLFDRSEVSKYLDTHCVGSSVSITRAQEMLRCGWGDVPRLVEAGFLKEEAKGISSKSIENFNNNYVCLSLLADEYGVQTTPLSRMLKARGHQPVLLSNGPSQRMFWERSVAASEAKNIRALPFKKRT